MDHIDIEYSNGRGKYGQQYAYVRPAKQCFNKSRRVKAENLNSLIVKHFPHVNYYKIDGHVIGAKDEESALKEYWRVCSKEKIGKHFQVYPTGCP